VELEPDSPPFFTAKTFELLAGLHETPTKDFYTAHKAEFKEYLEEPLRRLFESVRGACREEIRDCMETEKRVFSADFEKRLRRGRGLEWLWGAFYPKGGERTKDAQLFVTMHGNAWQQGFPSANIAGRSRRPFSITWRTP